jgi:hypothetical protein
VRERRLPDHPAALRLENEVFIGLVFTAAYDVSITLGPRFKCSSHFNPLQMLFAHFHH